MTGDRVIGFTTAAVVRAVAAFAAVVSYAHIYGLGRAHGQDGTAARLLPLSVDGLILAASLVLLHEARNDRAPALARFMLWLGIAVTIGANIAYGAGYGLLGALISAWPAVAFIGTAEIAMQQVRRARAPRAATSGPAVPEVPGDVEHAVQVAYAASVAAGAPLSQRAMAERFGLSRRRSASSSPASPSRATGCAGQEGSMSMNRYGVIAQRHWAQWLPRQYAAISDPESFFTTLGEEVARQIDDLTDELVSEIRRSDSYFAHVGRLVAARVIAEELTLPQRVLLDPGLAADHQHDVPPESGERPMVVERDHPSWAEVNAEQQERIHGPATD